VLITSDIDSMDERLLYEQMKWELRSDVVVVPHHGSAGSLNRMFFGYVSPRLAIISFGIGNTYGHPADAVYDVFSMMGTEVLTTEELEGSAIASNHIEAYSNGAYWMWSKLQTP
jgi:competence protein ComEC